MLLVWVSSNVISTTMQFYINFIIVSKNWPEDVVHVCTYHVPVCRHLQMASVGHNSIFYGLIYNDYNAGQIQ